MVLSVRKHAPCRVDSIRTQKLTRSRCIVNVHTVQYIETYYVPPNRKRESVELRSMFKFEID